MQVNITERIDTAEGKRYRPVIGPNGRIKPDWVTANSPMCSPFSRRKVCRN